MLKFLAVCSFGVGSSMILKLSLDKAIAELGLDAEAETLDISSVRGAPCDAVFTSVSIAEELRGVMRVPVYGIERYMDRAEVKAAVEKFIENREEK